MMNEATSQEFLSSADYDEDDLDGAIPGGAWTHTENDSLTDTLDEPVMATLMRDVKTIGVKFSHVFIPKKSSASRHLLQDYDLWGPLVVCCTLGLLLSDKNSEGIFSMVFIIVGLGSLTITGNTKLLGGNLSILQSICVMGYCMGPLVVSLIANKFILASIFGAGGVLFFLKLVSSGVAMAWCCFAALQFMVSSVSDEKRLLAVYPICLFYFVISWMIVTQ